MKELCKFKVGDAEFTLLAPSRAQLKEGEMVYAKTYANCLRSGLLTNEEVIKENERRGGIFTNEENDRLKKVIDSIIETQNSLKLDLSEEAKKDLQDEQNALFKEYNNYKSRQDSLFNLTAETKSRDKLVFHYALAMTHKDGKQFFDGRDFEAKTANFESHSEDKTVTEVFGRAVWYATAFASGVEDMSTVPYPEDPVKVEEIKP